MENQDNSSIPTAARQGVGDQLRAAREAQGLSLGDISAQTRVAERHLITIEQGRFADLAAPTYAVGFSRAYARAVGLDEAEIATRVRRIIDAQPHARPAPLPSFEPGDPARVPPSRIAWLAGLAAVVVVGLLVMYWTTYLSPEGALPDLLPEGAQTAAAPMAAAPRRAGPPVSAPGAASAGPVVLTASAPRVWVKVTDGTGNQLFQKELAQGESWTVPPGAQSPQLRTARPDQLQITVAGRAIPPLGDKPEVISGVLLTPAALTTRAGAGTAAPPAPQLQPQSAPSPAA
jgi:transcriptional regulator with XRE-family HTH domain